MTTEEQIAEYEREADAMLECARLNPEETGSSIYSQLAIIATKKAYWLRRVHA